MSPLSQSLPTEHARQVFTSSDTNNDGSVSALEFVNIMMKIRKYRMSSFVQDHLLSVSPSSNYSNEHHVSNMTGSRRWPH